MSKGGPLALSPEIDDLRQQFERISDEAAALVAPLSDEQFHWKPGPDAWSVAGCLEHMNATARAYLPAIDEGIGDAIKQGVYAEGPFQYNWVGRLFARLMEPPARIRMQTTEDKNPGPERGKRETLAGFRAYQVQYIDRLRQSNGIDLARARVRSPVSKWIRIPLGSAFAAMASHERRHLWQARRVMEHPGFPAAT